MRTSDTAPPGRVLIADDDATVREAVREVLSGAGLEVVGEAVDGEQALALAEELRPDVVLIDVRMPVLDGLGATRRIRAALPRTQVVVMSADDDRDSIRRSLEAGAAEHVVKGTGARALREAVNAAVALARSGGRSGPEPA